MNKNLLIIEDLSKNFYIPQGAFKRPKILRAVQNVSFSINRGDTVGIVGETGCGKSTLARTIIQLYKADAGHLMFHSKLRGSFDLTQLSAKELRSLRPSIQYVFQNPYSSLNQRMRIRNILCEPLMIQKNKMPKSEMVEKAMFYLNKVGLEKNILERYPYEFSGGQRQRLVLARALMLEPELLLCDEPVSALDVATQAKTLNLFKDLSEDLNLTYLFIAHDLSVVRYISDKIGVMYLGKVVEFGNAAEVYGNPKHPYTELLLSSIPNLGKPIIPVKDMNEITSEPLDDSCSFAFRCPYAKERCYHQIPQKDFSGGGHWALCHYMQELSLQGIMN